MREQENTGRKKNERAKGRERGGGGEREGGREGGRERGRMRKFDANKRGYVRGERKTTHTQKISGERKERGRKGGREGGRVRERRRMYVSQRE